MASILFVIISTGMISYLIAIKDLAKSTSKSNDIISSKVEQLSNLYLPVIGNMGFKKIWKTKDHMYISVYGSKQRLCSRPLKLEAISQKDITKTYTVDVVEFLNKSGTFKVPEKTELTPEGTVEYFGTWRLKPVPTGNFWFSVVHNCSGKLISTNFILQDFREKDIVLKQ